MDSDNIPATREYNIENGEIQTTLEAVSDLLTHLLPQDWSHVLLIIGPDSGSDLHNQRQVFGGIQATNKLDKKSHCQYATGILQADYCRGKGELQQMKSVKNLMSFLKDWGEESWDSLLLIALVVFVLFMFVRGLSGPIIKEKDSSSQQEDSIYKQKCLDAGGVPTTSAWDGRLTDCIILPKAKEKES